MKHFMKNMVSLCIGAGVGSGVSVYALKKKADEKLQKKQQTSDKHLKMFLLMRQWVNAMQEGKCVKDYFIKNNYNKIAIYGMSYIGETLLNELRKSEVRVVYGIDNRADALDFDMEILKPEEEFTKVDAVVVTAFYFFDEIYEQLKDKFDCPIVSIKDILDSI